VGVHTAHRQAELRTQALSQQLAATEQRASQLSDHAVSTADLPHQLAARDLELAAVTSALSKSRSATSAAEMRAQRLSEQVRP
jgi:hypothetical protein